MERTARDAGSCWTLSDGAAGNRRQVDALAAALAPGATALALASRRPWSWFAPRRLPRAEQAFDAGFCDRLTDPPRLAIGCGRQAALATRLLRERGSHAVQILNPRIDTRFWDVVVAPAHDRLAQANVIRTLGSLNPVDDAWLTEARAAWPQFGHLPGPRTLLLLGGPTAALPYGAAEVERWQRQLRHWFDDGGSLLVAGSRRTPSWLAAATRARFDDLPGTRWFSRTDGANPYAGMLAWAERIVVTPDSVNLLSEACATGVPVLSPLPPRRLGRIGRFHHALLESRRLRPLEAHCEPWTYPPLREAAEVAGEVRRRLGL